jgi:hypothetical protein
LLLNSSRSLEDIIYRAELDAMVHRDSHLRVVNTLTRKQPEGWTGHRGRIDKRCCPGVLPTRAKPENFCLRIYSFRGGRLNISGGTWT